MDNNHNNVCTGQGSGGNNADGAAENSNTSNNASATFTSFMSHDNFQNKDSQNHSGSGAAFIGQTFQVKTGEPTSRDSSSGGHFAIGSGIARPNSAPVPQSFDETYMGSVEQQNFDFQTFKAKIQAGSFNQVRDELASLSNTLDSSDSGHQEPYFKATSGGRKKRSNSDPYMSEAFFDAFPFDDEKDDKGRRGRQKEIHDRSKGPYKRSRSVDGVDHMANMAASLFPGFENDSDSEASAFDFKQDIEPIEVPFKNKPKRRSSEPLINPTFWEDSNFDFLGPDQMEQDLANKDCSQLVQPDNSEEGMKPSSRQRSNSEPMFSEDFANAFGEGDGGGKYANSNVDLFDSIQDVLGLDGSDRSFDTDEEKKPGASTSLKKNNSAPILSAEFFDTMFDDNRGALAPPKNKNQEQNDVAQDELDMFVNRMFKTEKPNQSHNQVWSSTGDHQRSRSFDALASFQTIADRINGNTQNGQLNYVSHQNNSTQEESLALYNMLFTGENTSAGRDSANSQYFSLPQTMDDQNMNFFGQNLLNSNQAAPSSCDDAIVFVLNAVKATQNQLQTLHPLVIKSGNVAAVEETARAFKTAALASQHILASDLPNAVAVLSKAQSSIGVIWAKISGSMGGGQRAQILRADGANVISGADIVNNGAQDSDSVCSSVTGASFNSRSNTPENMNQPAVKTSDFDGQSVMSTASNRSRRSSGSGRSRRSGGSRRSKCPDLKDLPPQDTSNPDIIMARLKGLMQRTQHSQKELQKWDKKNGLPKSHSQTMVNSSRSRKQLQEGVVLKKWNGVPLIGTEKK